MLFRCATHRPYRANPVGLQRCVDEHPWRPSPAVGMGLALTFPSIPGTIIGFGAVGFGIAILVPAAKHTADELPRLSGGNGT